VTAQKSRPAAARRPAGPARGSRPGPALKRTSNRWVFPAIVVGIVAILGVLLAISALGGDGGDGGDGGGGGGGDRVEVSAEVDVEGTGLPDFTGAGRDPAIGASAPRIGSVTFDGSSIEAGGATGSPYALIFLAHWCPHCQAEVPRLVALADGKTIEGVDVVGVATGTSEQRPNYPPSRWLAREEWPFPVLVDDVASTAARAYGLTSYPYMVFVDAQGKVAGRTSGEVSESDLRKIFSALAAGEPLPLPGAGGSSSSR